MPSETDPHPLNAVVWRALTGAQESLAEGDERARRYPPDIAPFAATVDTEPASFRSLLNLVGGDDRVALFTTEEVEPPSEFSVVRRDPVDQMVLEDAGACAAQPGAPIGALGVADVTQMLALANVTQPGPFGPRTIELGRYIGIRRQGVLVAMGGERMRLDGFTEISAVCVEPAHRGHGFAAELVTSLASCFQLEPCGYRPLPQVRLYPSTADAPRGAHTRGGLERRSHQDSPEASMEGKTGTLSGFVRVTAARLSMA